MGTRVKTWQALTDIILELKVRRKLDPRIEILAHEQEDPDTDTYMVRAFNREQGRILADDRVPSEFILFDNGARAQAIVQSIMRRATARLHELDQGEEGGLSSLPGTRGS